MLFVDHANVLKNLEKFKGRIDWERFGYILAFGSHSVGRFMYMGLPKKLSKEKKKFLKSLEICGYVIQPMPVQESPSGEKRQCGASEIFKSSYLLPSNVLELISKKFAEGRNSNVEFTIFKCYLVGGEVSIDTWKNSFYKVY